MSNIEIIENKNGLPISVIVPLSNNRKSFFNNFVLPLIQANNPKEIIINMEKGNAPKKRNEGYDHSTQPYLFFCDDDILLPKKLLKTFYKELEKYKNNNKIGYIYSGYIGIVLTNDHPVKNNYYIQSIEFDENKLKKYNYISTMSLIKRSIFPRFDEKLERFQDWDIYLTLLNKNIQGKNIKDLNFMAFYTDKGITSKMNIEESLNILRKKHNM